MADWSEPLDNYCERTDATFLSEPLNAITNLAFIVAFVAGWYYYQNYQEKSGRKHWEFVLLLGLICTIGVGSFLFHTFATRWALLTDSGPITIFQFVYMGVFCWHMIMPRWWIVPVSWAAFVVVTILLAIPFPADYANGSSGYFSSMFFIALLGGYAYYREGERAYFILVAAPLFAISIFFRSIDENICDSFSLGTHFVWHTLNGGMLYCLFVGLMKSSIEKEFS
tara:strand:+ start:2102 stop:2776 length:675 start_codon:yes stop_codon:yes gene_type:complete